MNRAPIFPTIPVHFRESQLHGNFSSRKLFLRDYNLRLRGRIFMNNTKEKMRAAAFLP